MAGRRNAGGDRADAGAIAGQTIPRIVFRPGSYLKAARDSIRFRCAVDLGGDVPDLAFGITELFGPKAGRIEGIGGQAPGLGQGHKPFDVLQTLRNHQTERTQMGTSRLWRAFSTTHY